jgi:hypothetical protein
MTLKAVGGVVNANGDIVQLIEGEVQHMALFIMANGLAVGAHFLDIKDSSHSSTDVVFM